MLLQSGIFTSEQLQAITRDYRRAGLAPREVAMMVFAEKIAADASRVGADDIEALRRHGFSDADVLDIALAAAARCFFSKVLDGVGAAPDAAYMKLDENLRRTLAVGRPFDGGTA